ncbi:MAG: porin family protein [Bacteroidales bacterium]
MKTKLISSVLFILFSISMAMSQEPGKISVGILGGVNFQNLNGKDYEGDQLENDLMTGFHAGINIQIPLAPEFYFQPGLLFSTKGAKKTSDGIKNTTNLSYIEMPLNLVYKALLGKGYFMLGLGPYLGYGIAGKVKSEGGGSTLERDIEFTSVVEIDDPLTEPYYKAFDAGGNIFFGYELASGIFAQMNAQLGMLKINPEYKILTDDKSSIKNTGFGFSLGYRF